MVLQSGPANSSAFSGMPGICFVVKLRKVPIKGTSDACIKRAKHEYGGIVPERS